MLEQRKKSFAAFLKAAEDYYDKYESTKFDTDKWVFLPDINEVADSPTLIGNFTVMMSTAEVGEVFDIDFDEALEASVGVTYALYGFATTTVLICQMYIDNIYRKLVESSFDYPSSFYTSYPWVEEATKVAMNIIDNINIEDVNIV